MSEQRNQPDESEDDATQTPGKEEPPQQAAEAPEPVVLSYSEYQELRTLAEERDDYLKRLQRAVADYQNLQKRIEKFRELARDSVLRSLADEILPMADSLGRALEAAQETQGAENIVEGLRLVEKEFYGALEKFGIRPVEAVGRRFDPHYHEAAMQESVEGVPPNTVVRELKKGFVMGDQVVRASQVSVTGPAAPQQGSACDEGPRSDEESSC